MDQDSSSLCMALGRPLPAAVRIISRNRDTIIIDLPSLSTEPVTVTRTAIFLDHDADMRVLDVLFALHARNRAVRSNVVGLAESSGRLNVWYGDPDTLDMARRVIQDATTAALFPYDQWTVDRITLAPMRDGIVDRELLPARDLLRTVSERYRLGLVTV